MTETEATLRMAELTIAAAKAVGEFALFMQRDYPALVAAIERGQALGKPMRDAIEAVEAFSAQWPQLTPLVVPDSPEKAAAISLLTQPMKH